MSKSVLCQIRGDVHIGRVREISADEGQWEFSRSDVREIEERVRGEEGVFVEVLIIHEGSSRKSDGSESIHYSRTTVREMAQLVPGTNAYLGHPDPSKREFEYRTPQAQYISARTELIDVEGEQVLALYGRAFISKAPSSEDLRIHLREGLAGPVSINGQALFMRANGVRTNKTVGMHSLESVDFVNPRTQGVKAAGVVGIVTEIQSAATGHEEPSTMSISSKDGLRKEYGDLVDAIVADALSEKEAAHKARVTEMADEAESLKATISERDEKITSLTAEIGQVKEAKKAVEAERDSAVARVTEMRTATAVAAAKDAFEAKFAERAAAAKGTNLGKVLETARAAFKVEASMIVAEDEDGSKTLEAVTQAFDSAVGRATEMAKSLGINVEDPETAAAPVKEIQTVVSTENPKGDEQGTNLSDLFHLRADRKKN